MPTDRDYLDRLWTRTFEKINRDIIAGATFDQAQQEALETRRLIDPDSRKMFIRRIEALNPSDIWIYTRIVMRRNQINASLIAAGKRPTFLNRFLYSDVYPPS